MAQSAGFVKMFRNVSFLFLRFCSFMFFQMDSQSPWQSQVEDTQSRTENVRCRKSYVWATTFDSGAGVSFQVGFG